MNHAVEADAVKVRRRSLVTIPGWSCGAGSWSRMLASLGLAGDCPDYRGVRTPAEFLPRVLACAGDGPSVLVGASMGGLLAVETALAKPAAVEAIVLVGGTPCFVSGERASGWPARVVVRMRRRIIEESGARASDGVVDAFQRRMFAPGEEDAAEAFLGEAGCRSGWDDDSLLAGLDYLLATDVTSTLADVRCPVLWIHGTDDTICPAAASERASVGHHRLIVPRAGHLPAWARPVETATAIARFLASETLSWAEGNV